MSPQHVQGYDIVEIEIRSPDGRAVLEVDRDLLVQFVDAAVALVPVGEESGPHGPRRGDPQDHAQLRGSDALRAA